VKKSTDRIITSHAGSLPRPDDLIELNRRRLDQEDVDESEYQARLRDATIEVVKRQADVGVDLPNDGEYGHAMGAKVDYGAWWSYSFQRFGGLGLGTDFNSIPSADPAGTIKLGTFPQRRDWNRFAEAYADPDSGVSAASARSSRRMSLPVAEGPLTYTGHEQVQRDIDNMKAGMAAAGVADGFLCSIGPGSASRIGNAYYKTDEEWVWACAEAMREEYHAITNAGLIVQIDEPSFAENWDQFNPEPTLEDYTKFNMVRVEALNHALQGIDPELIRFHLCWGSWHGPHTTDIALKDIVGSLVQINAGSFSFEAGNVRHEHEWKVWHDVDLDGRVLVPGVVSHATNVVEHPELVADRIERFANAAGRENVIAATDCGLGGRIHPQIGWAKLETLAEGARLATERLWK
jgi:5-methyltetrahydropteroyltriglutamate--homocysteine methyltransferase